MKLSSSSTSTYLGWFLAVSLALAPFCQAGRGSVGVQTINRQRKVQMGMDSGDAGGGGGGGGDEYAELLEGQCYICTPEVKVRPTLLTVQYIGGVGEISRYQTEDKADCRDQVFPETGTVSTNYGITYEVSPGAVITITNPGGDDGGELEANTFFTFSNGIECFIHTSCSQPLVGGDQIGPFLLLEGNDCVFSFCGDGVVDDGEMCDEGELMPTATCRDNCTIPICGDGIVDIDMGEECDEGGIMPTTTCRNCTIPFCGDGILDADMGELCDDGANGIDTDGCRDDCTIPSCGDGILDVGEECDDGANGDDTDGCRDDCTIPSCGDGILDVDLGEECDDGANGDDSDGCRDDCTIPFCGDGILDVSMGEECDDGANGDDSDGCLDDCTLCLCEARATYEDTTGAVTIDFDMCGQEPLESDWIGIYPCDAPTFVADQDWWDNTVCKQFSQACGRPFEEYGYVEGEEYVDQLYIWFSRTCGSPLDGGCQTDRSLIWPSSGTVTIDPTIPGADFAFLGGRTLEPGCYKVLLQREIDFISPPPFPTICAPWGEALEFQVPSPDLTSETSPLMIGTPNAQSAQSTQSGSLALPTLEISTFFASLVSFLVLYFGH